MEFFTNIHGEGSRSGIKDKFYWLIVSYNDKNHLYRYVSNRGM